MHKVKITVMRKARYDDLIEKYENPIEHACDIKLGEVFVSQNAQNPVVFVTVRGEFLSRLLKSLHVVEGIFTMAG